MNNHPFEFTKSSNKKKKKMAKKVAHSRIHRKMIVDVTRTHTNWFEKKV
jgi:hypothetical protein